MMMYGISNSNFLLSSFVSLIQCYITHIGPLSNLVIKKYTGICICVHHLRFDVLTVVAVLTRCHNPDDRNRHV
jgi:hypothetical protein